VSGYRTAPPARAARTGRLPRCRARALSLGFTVVELVVAMTIGLFVVGGASAAYVFNQRTRAELERGSRQVENGRYAMQLLADELRHAGYLGELNPRGLAPPAAMPLACENVLDELRAALTVPLQGVDDAASVPSCLSDVKPGTDIIAIRRASTCVAGTAGCTAFSAGHPHIQVSRCGAETAIARFRFASAAADLDRTNRDCSTPAGAHRYLSRIYYIASNNQAGDAIPTLKRAELNGTSWTIEPLVEGIENLQIDYGIDTDGNGSPDQYTSTPGSFGGCSSAACQVQNWSNVTAIKLNLLARNLEPTPGHTDNKTYVLGIDNAGAERTVGPFGDRFRRHSYSGTVRPNNIAGRRE
jgi:type IV pilus assembly protein PilW